MSLTREQVLAMELGVDLDALVAEFVFGWTRITGPIHDYHGPVEHGDVLIPPNTSTDEAFRLMPTKGIIPFTYFVNRHRYSTEISEAWELIEKMRDEGYRYCINVISEESGGVKRGEAEIGDVHVNFISEWHYYWAYAKSAQEAICKAALLAVLNL